MQSVWIQVLYLFVSWPPKMQKKDWAFSSGGERFPDTEEVTSSNLVTPTIKSAPRRSPPAGRFLLRVQTAACHSPPSPMALTQWHTRGEKPDSAPKRHGYRGMAAISCHTPVFVAGPDGAGAPLRHQTFLARFPSASALRQARNALASGA